MRFSMLCLTLSGVLWGTGGLLGSLLGQVAGLSPLTVACIRLLVGGGLMVAFLLVTGARRPRGRRAWRRIAVNGGLSALFQGCYFGAISLTSVSLATLVTIGAAPVIVAVVERVRGGQPLGLPGVITQGLALVGLLLLVGGPALTGTAGTGASGTGNAGAAMAGGSGLTVLAGCGLALLSAAGFAAITLIGSSPVPGLRDLTVNGYGFTLGGVILVPFAAVSAGSGSGAGIGSTAGSAFTTGSAAELAAAAGLLAGLVIGPTAVAYTLYYRGLRAESASTAALLTLLEPLTAAILGIVLLGDRLGPIGVVGAVILGAALVRAALMPAGVGSDSRIGRSDDRSGEDFTEAARSAAGTAAAAGNASGKGSWSDTSGRNLARGARGARGRGNLDAEAVSAGGGEGEEAGDAEAVAGEC